MNRLIDGIALEDSEVGERSVILLHGFLESNDMWSVLELEKNYRTLRIELPGHGKSKDKLDNQSIATVAQKINTILQKLKLKTYDIIGHSLGGYVGLEMIKQTKPKGKLILLHSNFWQDSQQKQKDRERVAQIAMTNKDYLIAEAIPSLFNDPDQYRSEIGQLILIAKGMSAESVANWSIAMKNRSDHSSTLNLYPNEISWVQGENDKLAPHELLSEKRQTVKNELRMIPSAGHMGHIENSYAVRTQILDLLNDSNTRINAHCR